jgi:uncharacterized protein YjbI with pentapeptide repeats
MICKALVPFIGVRYNHPFREKKMCFFKRNISFTIVWILVFFGNSFVFAANETIQENNRKRLIATNSCPGCDLSGINLDRVNLPGANLEGANLSRTKLHLATLAKANLRKTILRGAEFGGSDLAGADLRGADLRGATFAGAYFVGAQLDSGVDLNQPVAEVTLDPAQAGAVSEKQAPATVSTGGTGEVQWTGKGQNNSDELSKNKSPALPQTQEPGFMEKTWESMKGVFGQDKAAEPKVVAEKTDVSLKTEKVIPKAAQVKDVTPPASSVKVEPLVDVKRKEKAAPVEEVGFFGKTVESVKEMFGQGKTEEAKVDVKKANELKAVNEIPSKGPTAQTSSDAAAVATAPPAKVQQAVEEPGLFDKTVSSVKGWFGFDDIDKSKVTAKKTGEAATSAKESPQVQPPIAKQVAVEKKEASPVVAPPVVENKEADLQGRKTLQEKKMVGAAPVQINEPDSAVEIEKNRQRLLDTRKCYGCNLQGVDLTGKNLGGADFEGADLTGSRLAGTDLEDANLKGAILVGADLRNADLEGADFYKANLSKADLTGAKLKGALLDDAQLTGTVGYEQKTGK